MSAPQLPIFHIVLQRTRMDCAIACLASALGRSYEGILAAASALYGDGVLSDGLNNIELMAVAEGFGKTLIRKRHTKRTKIDLEDDTGILGIKFPGQKRNMHAVLLTHGLIIDPSDQGVIWEAEDYVKHHQVKLVDLLEVTE